MHFLPVFDLSRFLSAGEGAEAGAVLETCQQMASCLESTGGRKEDRDSLAHVLQLAEGVGGCWPGCRAPELGALIVRDPRCTEEDNERFLSMMERYFEQPGATKMADSRPDLHYQVGSTPEGVEVPQCVADKQMRADIDAMDPAAMPVVPSGADAKWRFMWRVGKRPSQTKFAELNASPVIPAGFSEWSEVMDNWGHKMISAVEVVSEMLALGMNLDRDAFTKLMNEGPHLLAPTGSDLGRHTQEGRVLAGYHSDLNFLTIHGRCRYPGLFIWLRDGRKVPVSVPPGCLLLQAGKQMEWLTGGAVRAGMHEVVVTPAAAAAAQKAREENRSVWRVSSTTFGHIASDQVLRPLGHFAATPDAQRYQPIAAGTFVEAELALICLKENGGSLGMGQGGARVPPERGPIVQVGA